MLALLSTPCPALLIASSNCTAAPLDFLNLAVGEQKVFPPLALIRLPVNVQKRSFVKCWLSYKKLCYAKIGAVVTLRSEIMGTFH